MLKIDLISKYCCRSCKKKRQSLRILKQIYKQDKKTIAQISLDNVDENLQVPIINNAYVVSLSIINISLFIDVFLSNALFIKTNTRLRDTLTKQS